MRRIADWPTGRKLMFGMIYGRPGRPSLGSRSAGAWRRRRGLPAPAFRDDPGVGHLDLWDAFAVLIAVAGPPKVALSFARLAGENTAAQMRALALRATGAAMVCGAIVALIADPLLALFHIGHPAIMVAGGAIFFVYALRLVMHGHTEIAPGRGDGFSALLLPYIASPLALSSVIVLSALTGGWGWSAAIALAYLGVAAINLVVMLGLTLVVHRVPGTWVEVAGRVLGLLLAGVGVELILDGLATIKVVSTAR